MGKLVERKRCQAGPRTRREEEGEPMESRAAGVMGVKGAESELGDDGKWGEGTRISETTTG